jgi:hypothetical protein
MQEDGIECNVRMQSSTRIVPKSAAVAPSTRGNISLLIPACLIIIEKEEEGEQGGEPDKTYDLI